MATETSKSSRCTAARRAAICSSSRCARAVAASRRSCATSASSALHRVGRVPLRAHGLGLLARLGQRVALRADLHRALLRLPHRAHDLEVALARVGEHDLPLLPLPLERVARGEQLAE